MKQNTLYLLCSNMVLASLVNTAYGQSDDDSNNDQPCGPFQITSTSGGLYSDPNGVQYPGADNLEGTSGYAEYLINSNGTITNTTGSICSFQPYFTCDSTINDDNLPSLPFSTLEFSQLAYGGNATFYLCSSPPPSTTESSNTNPGLAQSYILPAPSATEDENSNGLPDEYNGCRTLSLQASRCSDVASNVSGVSTSTSAPADATKSPSSTTISGTASSGTEIATVETSSNAAMKVGEQDFGNGIAIFAGVLAGLVI